jgi:hypothetical protein
MKKQYLTLLIFCSIPLLYACTLSFTTPNSQRSSASQNDSSAKRERSYGVPVHLANLEDQVINESSGIAASRKNSGIYWTHNDSGDGAFLYAFDREGKKRGTWQLVGAKAVDWEDIAIGGGPNSNESYIYVGDIGDNNHNRKQIIIYRFLEPHIKPENATSNKKKPLKILKIDKIQVEYPDSPHDAEALMVHPKTKDLYIITKATGASSGVYKLEASYSLSKLNRLKLITDINFPGLLGNMITGGDISPDGKSVIVCNYARGFELKLEGRSNTDFDSIWKQETREIDLGQRQQGESICYNKDGKSILYTSEGRPTPLMEVSIGHGLD